MQNSTLESIYLTLGSIYLDSFSHLISVLYMNYIVHDYNVISVLYMILCMITMFLISCEYSTKHSSKKHQRLQ